MYLHSVRSIQACEIRRVRARSPGLTASGPRTRSPRGPADPVRVSLRLGDLRSHLLDAAEHLAPQIGRDRIASARLADELLDHFFETVLAQARAALVEVLPDLRAAPLCEFSVEIGIDLGEHFVTRLLVGVSAAHAESSLFAPVRVSP